MKNLNDKINVNKIYIFYFIFLIISLVIVAIVTGNSFEGKDFYNKKDIDIENFTTASSKVNDKYYDDTSSLEDIFDKSKIILKVKMTDDIEYMNQCRLSKVQVLKVYKNEEKIELNEKIYIYEPVYPHIESNEVYLDGGYLPMLKDKEYIVLLKSLKVPNEYKMSKKEEQSFMYYSLIFGKYCIDNLSPYIISDGLGNSLHLKDLEEHNVMIDNKNLDKYNTFVKMISKYK